MVKKITHKNVKDSDGVLIALGDDVIIKHPSGSLRPAIVIGIPYDDRVRVREQGSSVDIDVPPEWIGRPW